jgi:hypothetical protein
LRTGESLLLFTALMGLTLYAALLGEALRSTLEDEGGLCRGDQDLALELGIWLSVDAAVGTTMAMIVLIVAVFYACGTDFTRNRTRSLCLIGSSLACGIVFLFGWSFYGGYIVWDDANGKFSECDELARVLAQLVMYFQIIAVAVVGTVILYALRRPLLLRCRCCSRCWCCKSCAQDPADDRDVQVSEWGGPV